MSSRPKHKAKRPASATVSSSVKKNQSMRQRRTSTNSTNSSHNGQCSTPTSPAPGQRLQFVQQNDFPESPSLNEYTVDNLQDLLNLLQSVTSKWYHIGIALIGIEKVNVISQDFIDTQTRFTKILESRLRQGPLSTLDLHKILCLSSVGEKDLAHRIISAPVNDPIPNPPMGADELLITKNNVIHCIKPDVHTTVFPYTQLRRNYNFTAFFFALFLFLQVLVMVDNHDWVKPRNYTVQQYTNRLVFFILYTLLMIVTPSVCYVQFCRLGSYEKHFLRSEDTTRIQINTTTQNELNTIVQERQVSLNPVELILHFASFLKLNFFQVDIKRFQVLMHALTLPCLLFAIRAFDDNTSKIGWRNFRIGGQRVVDIWENISFIIVFFLTGTIKDLYCFENHIATILSEDDSNRNSPSRLVSQNIFCAVRKRWVIMDVYAHILSVIFTVLAVLLFLYGKPFTPRYLLVENALEQHAWNVVTVLIILLQFAGSSANPILKLVCSICYIALPFIVCAVMYEDFQNDEFNIHLPRGNALLLIFVTQLVSLINWLLCLFNCYWRQDNLSNVWYHLCLTAIILVFGCLCYAHVREFKYYIHDRNCTCSCNCTAINGTVYNMQMVI